MPICKDCLGYRFCSMRDNENFTEKERLCFTNKNRFVEVVRCKDCECCKLCYPAKAIGEEAIEGYYCNMFKQYRKPNDFCSYGERKECERK